MYEYRITKYNPAFRNSNGTFLKGEWTSYSDVGGTFSGVALSLDDYLLIESQYICAVISMMEYSGIGELSIKGLEVRNDDFDENTTDEMMKLLKVIKSSEKVNIVDIPSICRLILREYIWAKLEGGTMFVHFGYDYYMYIGLAQEPREAIEQIRNGGLFVEKYCSPYKS
ncbi:hypothetical protein [Listeria booriae]|uniref:hypothetical protein n=1 Tax=Listeria booriae TaxID=1552123 RepID=UPI0016266DC2|nr:hypothetical protein [Listeria booriae]MBC2322557.1 hypothetical protein [Listeria booriae]MCD2206437.1 hypothetical protein [Listeria booriae]